MERGAGTIDMTVDHSLILSSSKQNQREIRNVIFLTVDCLRFCYLRVGGNSSDICPTINSLADNGIICTNARAHSNPTQLSYPAIFSSTLPLDYGGYDHGILKRPLTIAEALGNIGLYTVGFSPTAWLGLFFGYDRGFDDFYELFDINKFWEIFANIYHKFYTKLLKRGIICDGDFCQIVGGLFERFLTELLRLCAQTSSQLTQNRFPYDISLHRHNFALYQAILKRMRTEFLHNPDQYILANLAHDIINNIKPFLTGVVEKSDRRDITTYLLRAVKKFLRLFGLQFRHYQHSVSAAYLRKQVNLAISNNKERRFFIWTHFLEIHDQFCIPGRVGLAPDFVSLGLKRACDVDNPATMERTFCLRAVDKQIAQIIAKLKSENLLESTLIVIYGDHGFPVKSPEKDAGNLFDESARVPIIFYNPNMEHNIISVHCGLVDIAPTVLSLMGANSRPEFKGISLTHNLDPDHSIILESLGAGPGDFHFKAIKIAVVRGKYKLIWREPGYEDSCPNGQVYLFNIEDDPAETTNLYWNKAFAAVVSELERIATERAKTLRRR